MMTSLLKKLPRKNSKQSKTISAQNISGYYHLRHDVDEDMYADEVQEKAPKKKKIVKKDTKKAQEALEEMDFERKMRAKVLEAKGLSKKKKEVKEDAMEEENLSAEQKAKLEYERIKRELIAQRGSKRKRDDEEIEEDPSELEKLKQAFMQPRKSKKQKQKDVTQIFFSYQSCASQ